jgi:hypothetical protein
LNNPNLKLGTPIRMDWADSKSALGWSYDPKKKRTPGKIYSIGFVVECNDECITITTSMDHRGASIDDFSVPLGCVSKLQVLGGDCGFRTENNPVQSVQGA